MFTSEFLGLVVMGVFCWLMEKIFSLRLKTYTHFGGCPSWEILLRSGGEHIHETWISVLKRCEC